MSQESCPEQWRNLEEWQLVLWPSNNSANNEEDYDSDTSIESGDIPELEVEMADIPITKREKYFYIEKILQHKLTTKRTIENNRIGRRKVVARHFLVKWKNFDDKHNSWEPEDCLDGCLELLNDYLREHDLEPTKNKLYAGSSNKTEEVENYVEEKKALEILKTYAKLTSYSSDAKIISITEEEMPEGNWLGLFTTDFHMYAIVKSQGKFWIADGSNKYMKSRKARRQIVKTLGEKPTPVEFKNQSKDDHCASSCIVIALEFLRQHKQKELGKKLQPRLNLLKKLKEQLHKAKTEAPSLYREEKNLERRTKIICECGWKAKTNKKQALAAHKKHCKI